MKFIIDAELRCPQSTAAMMFNKIIKQVYTKDQTSLLLLYISNNSTGRRLHFHLLETETTEWSLKVYHLHLIVIGD